MLTGVSATALLTLKARADEDRRKKRLFADPWAEEWYRRIEVPAALERKYSRWIQLKTAVRVDQIDELVRSAIDAGADSVVELACGLSSRRQRLGDLPVRWFDLDLPEVIKLRAALGITGLGHRHLSHSVLDRAWLDALEGATSEQTVMIAEGLFYYLPQVEVEALFLDLRRRFPGARLIFDVIGELDLPAAMAHSRRLGAPILWAVRSPFERAMHELGLDPWPGAEPDKLLSGAISRLGPGLKQLTALAAKIRWLRDRRSGLMAGRLRPL